MHNQTLVQTKKANSCLHENLGLGSVKGNSAAVLLHMNAKRGKSTPKARATIEYGIMDL